MQLNADFSQRAKDGDFPMPFPVRNPPASTHRPAAQDGTKSFIKLHQCALANRTGAQVDTPTAPWPNMAPA
jgi:hypothetical protein